MTSSTSRSGIAKVAPGHWWRRSSYAGGKASRMMRRGISLFVGVFWRARSGLMSVSSKSFLILHHHHHRACQTHCHTHPDRGAHLHLFLHARGMLSAAVRMNILGPYA